METEAPSVLKFHKIQNGQTDKKNNRTKITKLPRSRQFLEERRSYFLKDNLASFGVHRYSRFVVEVAQVRAGKFRRVGKCDRVRLGEVIVLLLTVLGQINNDGTILELVLF